MAAVGFSPSHHCAGHDLAFFFFFFLFVFFLKNNNFRGGVIIFSYHFCYLFDVKIDKSLEFKIIINSGLKFANWKLRFKSQNQIKHRGFHYIFPKSN
jgi:hypothetical protein